MPHPARHLAILISIALAASLARTAEPASAIPADDPAAEHVEAALRAELVGNNAERDALLERAASLSPDYGPARWQSGQLEMDGEWRGIEESWQRLKDDPRRKRYRRLVDLALDDSVAEQLAVARWCRSSKLPEEADFHYRKVLAVDPQNREALRGLGAQWFRGELLKHDEVKRRRAEELAAEKAAEHYGPLLERIAQDLEGESPEVSAAARNELLSIRDPSAVPSLVAAAADADGEFALCSVEAISQIDEQVSTRALAWLALQSLPKGVHKLVVQRLTERPLYDYVPLLFSSLQAPIELKEMRLEVLPTAGVAYTALYEQDGLQATRRIEHQSVGQSLILEREGFLYQNQRSFAQQVALSDAQRVYRSVEELNSEMNSENRRVFRLLQETTGMRLGDDQDEWWDWWIRYNERQPAPKPVFTAQSWVVRSNIYVRPPRIFSSSCFPKGTPVWTEAGLVDIERVRMGDRVLAQDVETGELAYCLVEGTTTRPPSPLVALTVEGETIRTTAGHPLWRSGQGWRMAKTIETGDLLHGLGGSFAVEAAESAGPREAHNLIVAGLHTYFVGEQGLLVHDNTWQLPVRAALPGLMRDESAVPEIVSKR